MSLTSMNRTKNSAAAATSSAVNPTPNTSPIRFKVSIHPKTDVIIDKFDSKMYRMENHKTEAIIYAFDEKNHPHQLQRRYTLILAPDISCRPVVWNNRILFCHSTHAYRNKTGITLNSFDLNTETLQTYQLDVDIKSDLIHAELQASDKQTKIYFKTATQANGEFQSVMFDWTHGSYQLNNNSKNTDAKIENNSSSRHSNRHAFFYSTPQGVTLTCHDKNAWQDDPYNRAPEKLKKTPGCFGF